ncbi:MAG: zinc transporter [Sulfitobacter sp.]|jgi:zinc transporter
MALCVFDIFPDGTSSAARDTALTGGGRYRWWHFDLGDPALHGWLSDNLPQIPAGALVQPETRPRCDIFEDGLILNLRGINLNAGQPADQMVSVRMWVADDVIITVRMRKVFALEDIRQSIQAGQPPRNPAAFVEALVARLTSRVQDEVLEIARLAGFYEADLEDETTPPPKDLPATRRRVIRLRRYLEPQRTALTTLAAIDLPLMNETDALRLRELANRTTLAVEELDALQDRLITVQDDHDLFVARKQALHGYRLSIAAGIFLPLGFLTGLFGVNIGGMPGLDSPMAFAWLCLGMAGMAVLMLVILKLGKWL